MSLRSTRRLDPSRPVAGVTRKTGHHRALPRVTSVPAVVAAIVAAVLAGCGTAGDDDDAGSPPAVTAPQSTSTSTAEASVPSSSTVSPAPPVTTPRPAWLGSRTLPTNGDGFGIAVATPAELVDRRFATVDTLPPPPDDRFHATVERLSDVPDALARSTWTEGCPVPPEELAYLTVSFHGFDGLNHTGDMIVAYAVADDIVSVFEQLHAARFPIEEMRIVTRADLDAAPTGDTNDTTGFVCRPVTGGTSFSEHAMGLAIDVNPFHNPYIRGDLVLPELAVVYTDRSRDRPGMIQPGDVVVEAFTAIGWKWGGDWTSLKDYQHFSANGR